MYRIRLHGRGGQGMKTASRILGTALFLTGYETQDAPRYGAERRGAPVFAYVRASHDPIYERGIITHPDLVIVADDSLVALPGAGVLTGIDDHTVLLINTDEDAITWQQRLNITGNVFTLPAEAESRDELRFIGASCSGASASLLGVISRDTLAQAIKQELAELGDEIVEKNLLKALNAFEEMALHTGIVTGHENIAAIHYQSPAWIDLHCDNATISAPAIHAAATSVEVKTGLWRTLRPVIDYEHCSRCWWVCSTFCPDGAISIDDTGQPHIDYDHCKGCMVCVAQCPPHAISAIPEQLAQTQAMAGAST